jgi:hypothetical protein
MWPPRAWLSRSRAAALKTWSRLRRRVSSSHCVDWTYRRVHKTAVRGIPPAQLRAINFRLRHLWRCRVLFSSADRCKV